ncbi:MAG: KH domain-containing protein [Nitrososphaerales archaeon]
MLFEQEVRIPLDRVGVLLGKEGSVKNQIEKLCDVKLEVDGKNGDVKIICKKNIEKADPFKAVEIVKAIGRGFSPDRALKLLNEDHTLEIIDLREYAGKSEDSLFRIKGRIIGLKGKARRVIEELTDVEIAVYGHTVSIIGNLEGVRMANEAVRMLAIGKSHNSVYNMLQKYRAKAKLEKYKLWEREYD